MKTYTENEKNAAKMLIKFFNLQAGSAYRCGGEENPDSNISLALAALELVPLSEARSFVVEFVRESGKDNSFVDCMRQLMAKHHEAGAKAEESPISVPAKEAEPVAQVTEQQVTNSLGILEQALVQVVAQTSASKIESEIMSQVKDMVKSFISSEYGPIKREIITAIDGKPCQVKGIQHEKFETVLKFVANDEPVYLVGPAGSGKNVLCKQVAEALGLNFYFSNAVTQEYKLTGFTDAMGNYQESQFYKAFKNGGLFMLDEMDASIPEVLVILNAAIANRYFDFPAPIGYVEAHPDFRVIAAGNTVGQGADYEYVGRQQLDAASLDRFAVVKVDYSAQVEDAVAGDVELADFCRSFREAARKAGQQVVVSYRAIGRLAKMMQVLSMEEALQTCLVKGMEKDDLNIICNELPESIYKRALRKVVGGM